MDDACPGEFVPHVQLTSDGPEQERMFGHLVAVAAAEQLSDGEPFTAVVTSVLNYRSERTFTEVVTVSGADEYSLFTSEGQMSVLSIRGFGF